MRIVYMGTPDFAVPALTCLYERGHEILCAVSQPDKPQGRHAETVPTPVKKEAERLGIPVLQPVKATDPSFLEKIREMAPDAVVVAAYGKILRKAFLDIPKYGCINIHASLLPKYRGSAPIQQAVINGDEKTGVTIMKLDEGMDTGGILLQKEVTIDPEETGGSLFEKLSLIGGPLCDEALRALENGTLSPKAQDESLATMAPPLTKEMGEMNFEKEAAVLERLVRGLSPWPGTYTAVNGKLLKIHKVSVCEGSFGEIPGTFLPGNSELIVVCGNGTALRITELQMEGKKRMSAEEFLRGQRKVFME